MNTIFEYLQNDRLLNFMLIAAIVGDFAVPYLLAPFYKSYKHSLAVMSSLGNPDSPVRIIYNIWLVLLGSLLIPSCAVICARYWSVSKPLTVATVVLLLIFAIGAGILSGIFSVNENKKVVTLSSKIHGAGSALGFMALLLTPLFLAILSYKGSNKTAGTLFVIAFVLAFIFFCFFVMSDKPCFQNTWIKYEGLWQRLSLLLMYFPLGYIAVENLIFQIG